jgi:cytochrome c5
MAEELVFVRHHEKQQGNSTVHEADGFTSGKTLCSGPCANCHASSLNRIFDKHYEYMFKQTKCS